METVDTTDWPARLRDVEIPLAENEQVVEVDYKGARRYVLEYSGVLILTNLRLVNVYMEVMTRDEQKLAYPTFTTRFAAMRPPFGRIPRIWSVSLSDITHARTTIGAPFGEWFRAIAGLIIFFPITFLLFATRRLGIDFRDENDKAATNYFHVKNPRKWAERITAAASVDSPL